MGHGGALARVNDASAIGRVWALLTAADGLSVDAAAQSVPAPSGQVGGREVHRTFRELGVQPGEPTGDKARAEAMRRFACEQFPSRFILNRPSMGVVERP